MRLKQNIVFTACILRALVRVPGATCFYYEQKDSLYIFTLQLVDSYLTSEFNHDRKNIKFIYLNMGEEKMLIGTNFPLVS